MKILVTGANGQLGTDLKLRLQNFAFECLYTDSKKLDITDRENVLSTILKEKPDLIINCAAYTKVDLAEKEQDEAFKVNSTGVANLALAAKEANSFIIHISTDFVFDGNKSSPYNENDVTNPLSVYGKSKLGGEEQILKISEKFMIIRTSWLYGAHGANFVKTIIRLANEREKLTIVHDQIGSPTWTGDLADTLVEITKKIEQKKILKGIYHFANEGAASWYDFAYAAVEEYKKFSPDLKCKYIQPIPTSSYPTPAKRPFYSVLDKSKIKDDLGILIPNWRSSLKKMINEITGD